MTIEADRRSSSAIFANLTQNAAQAGATRIEVRPRHGKAMAEVVIVEVADNGPGPAAAGARQSVPALRRLGPAGRIGLGLAIVRELVRAHGGKIRLLRSTADGTVFAVELPQRHGRSGPHRAPVAQSRAAS